MAIDAAVLRARVEVQGIQQAQAQLKGFGAQINTIGTQTKSAAGGVTAMGNAAGATGGKLGAAGKNAGVLGSVIGDVSAKSLLAGAGLAGLGFQAVNMGKQMVGAGIAWESSLAGIAKTLDTTGLSAAEADAAVQQMGNDIRQMATEIPIAATELAGVAEAAGQLGVAREDVVAFTETMAKLGVATDLTAEQAAEAIARIANITGLATEDVDNFGAALVDLGNNSAATEAEILEMATRIAASGTQAGLTEGEILGLAAALTSVGINAEAGGTAIVQVMNEIETSVESADERLATFAEIAGMSADQFAQAWRENPNEALVSFVEGLGDVTEMGGSTVQILDELGLDGIRVSQALNSAAGAGDLMRESMDRGNTAMAEGTALNKEAAQRFETTASKIQLLKNNLNEFNLQLSGVYIPALQLSIDYTILWANEVQNASEMGHEFAGNLGILADALGDFVPLIDVAGDKTGGFGDALRDAVVGGIPILNLMDSVNDTFRFFGAGAEEATELTKEQTAAVDEWLRRIGQAIPTVGAAQQAQTELTQEHHRGAQAAREYGVEINNLDEAHRAYVSSSQMAADATRRQNMEFDASVAAMDETTAGYDRAISAMIDIFHNAPEAAGEVVDDLILAFQNGRLDLDSIMRIFGQIPEDAIYEHFMPAFADLRTDWLTTIASLGEGTPEAEAGLRALDSIMQALGLSFDSTAEKALNFGDIQDTFQLNIDNASAKVSEWQGNLSGAEEALGFLQEKIDAGIPLTEKQQEQYDTLTWASERYKGGIEDESEALIDAEVAKANYIRVLDEVNAMLDEDASKQDLANQMLEEARKQLDPATRMTLENADAQETLAAGLDKTVEKMALLLYHAGLISETEAEAIIGADITEAEENVDHMEGRLQTYEETDHITTADVDSSGAVAKIDGVEGELTAYAGATWTTTVTADVSAAEAEIARIKSIISSGAMLPVAISASENLSGFAGGTGPGGTTKDQIAWVGEEGPELVFLPQGAHVLPNDESKKFAALMGEIPGYADGTEGGGGSSSGGGFVGFDWSFLFAGLEAAAAHFSEEALEHIKNFVDAANAALETLGTALDFATASAEFQASGVGLPGDEFLHHLSAFTSAVTYEMGQMAAKFEDEFLEHVGVYADAAGAAMDLLGQGIEVLSGLEANVIDLEAGKEAVTEVKIISEKLVKDLGDSAAKFASQEPEGFVGAAQMFAEAAVSGIDLLDAGIDALEGLGPNAINLEAAKEAVTEIKFISEKLMKDLGDTAAKFASQEDDGFLGAAQAFAEAALPAMELMGTALDAISTLTEMGGEFNLADAKEAATEVKFVVEHLVKSIGDAAAVLALHESEDFLTGMQDYADAVGPAIDLMSDTLNLMDELAGMDLGNVFARDFALLFQQLATVSKMAAEAIARAAADWAVEVNPAIEVFADEAGSSLGLLGDSLSFVTDLRDTDLEGLFAQDFSLLFQQLSDVARMVAEAVGRAARNWPNEVNPAIEAFTEEAGASLSLIGDAADAIEAILSLADEDDEERKPLDVDTLAAGLIEMAELVTEAVAAAAEEFETDGLEATEKFANAAGAAFNMMSDAVDAFEGMAEMSELGPEHMDVFLANYEIAIDTVEQIALLLEDDGIDNADRVLEAAQDIADILGAANDAIESISPPSVGDSSSGSVSGGSSSSGGSSGGGRSSSGGASGDPNALIPPPPDGALGYFYDRRLLVHDLDAPGGEAWLSTADTRGINRFYYNPEGGGDEKLRIGFDEAADLLLGTGRMRQFAAFADGGVTLGPSLAILGDNPSGKEMVLPFERNREFAQQIAQELAVTLRSTGMGGGDIVLQVDGQTLGRITSGHVNGMARSHVSQSGIPVGLGRR